ncbi:mevalonate kinase [Phytophthora nicotianae INRA-310]|uniref:Mevalonate kinase n=1 Tax=Phytophthora nicotianae (strain INRA-310) TaxID=761204 RepID=W2RAX7_PHYN3|nr:mevalonate kinase [Phytophthora nicotianae INRA-310]ETN22381.1 mevalonate kinase [Phytophthora nicotianae INRA-310]
MGGDREVVRVSAPGKLLLLGEHAVVYGCPVVAAALSDLRIKAEITRIHVPAGIEPSIEFSCKDIKSTGDKQPLRRTYATSALQKVVAGLEDEVQYVPTPSQEVMTRIDGVLEGETPEDAKTMRAPLFLCCALLRSSGYLSGSKGGLHVEVETCGLPIGAGLGSSAAMSVALSGAFAELSGSSRKHELDFINEYAFGAEVILHGSPSGADNTVSCFGGTLLFQKHPEPSFDRIQCPLNKFRFLLVNTRVPRSTKVQVANVRKRYEADREKVQKQFDTIQQLVEKFVALSERKVLSEEVLGQEIEHNQQILSDLGVGHPQIDEVARICKQFNGSTKLTGAGGGGCTISLLPRGLSNEDLAKLITRLEAKGFECYASSIGGPGLIRA